MSISYLSIIVWQHQWTINILGCAFNCFSSLIICWLHCKFHHLSRMMNMHSCATGTAYQNGDNLFFQIKNKESQLSPFFFFLRSPFTQSTTVLHAYSFMLHLTPRVTSLSFIQLMTGKTTDTDGPCPAYHPPVPPGPFWQGYALSLHLPPCITIGGCCNPGARFCMWLCWSSWSSPGPTAQAF